MDRSTMSVFSLSSWMFAAATFFVGIIVKYLFNIVSSPTLEIEKYIVLDDKNNPFIRVKNKSKKIDAYDLHFFIRYYERNIRKHTKIIEDGILKRGKDDEYSIIPKDQKGDDISFGFSDTNNHVEVIIIYRNKFNKLSEQEVRLCYPFKSK